MVSLLLGMFQSGCIGFVERHELQSDSWVQVLQSEQSQVKVRTAQSRFYDTKDKRAMLAAIVATMQDLDFQIAVLDVELGVVSGKKYMTAERPGEVGLPSYLLYDEESLVALNRVYRSWGPFQARADLVRLTVTVRDRNEEQIIVRASAQHFLRPVETRAAYLQFFGSLESSLFAARSVDKGGAFDDPTPAEEVPATPEVSPQETPLELEPSAD